MRVLLLLAPVLTVSAACKKDDDSGDSGDEGRICTEPVEPPCIDEMILDLSLHDDKVSDGEVTNAPDGTGWTTTFDASAGGMQSAPDNPWLYLKFTDQGAVRVDIDDETALESMEWHLSARRFILRLNGGTSGPSCVGGAALFESTYESLAAIPEGLNYATDDYYTQDCTIINDSSGLEGSPQVVLAQWWSYDTSQGMGCVTTTGIPYLIRLDDGRIFKLVVDAYYESGQEECNTSGVAGTGSGHFSVRWAFLP